MAEQNEYGTKEECGCGMCFICDPEPAVQPDAECLHCSHKLHLHYKNKSGNMQCSIKKCSCKNPEAAPDVTFGRSWWPVPPPESKTGHE